MQDILYNINDYTNRYFLLICTFLILCILFNLSLKKKHDNTLDTFSDTPDKIYTTYELLDNNSVKYELLTFSQLNFDLQKKILDKIINNEISMTANELKLNFFSKLFFSNEKPSVNFYKNLFDIDVTTALIETNTNYIHVNDIVFAVRLNRIKDDKIINNNQHLVFNVNKDISYSITNNLAIKPSKAQLLLYNSILTVTPHSL